MCHPLPLFLSLCPFLNQGTNITGRILIARSTRSPPWFPPQTYVKGWMRSIYMFVCLCVWRDHMHAMWYLAHQMQRKQWYLYIAPHALQCPYCYTRSWDSNDEGVGVHKWHKPSHSWHVYSVFETCLTPVCLLSSIYRLPPSLFAVHQFAYGVGGAESQRCGDISSLSRCAAVPSFALYGRSDILFPPIILLSTCTHPYCLL